MTRIAVDPARVVGELDRNVFGGFVEHLGRCIYGGLYEEGSPLSDQRGFRQDVLGLLRELRMGVLRWPGGNFVSNYHWKDGIGPAGERPVRPELAWGGEESNRFGTDEFLRYCADLGTEPYICLNMGTGTLAEALDWVEYCNGAGQTEWARRRRDNGQAQPYQVRYWGLGNEMYGDWQVGAMPAEEYVREATRWARAIRMLDPGAKLISCGMNGWNEWDRVVIDGMAPLVDYHSLHIYTGSDDYWTNVLQPHQAERAIACARTLIERAAYVKRIARPPRIAYDEWNVWFRTDDGTLEERYTFPDALAVGTYLNIFTRNCDWVRMANLAQMVNAIAPIVTTPETAVTQTIYYPVLL
ncbi:MAG TPA: alpha-L-arabinofuranosidase C-terminal domain-containing protein, partial [Streptosporangiaceae bacterium]|nr:alpha-L-arabinofuranosidase C-terminal domain-containing protein [Streptosporangiaceae bacterium]